MLRHVFILLLCIPAGCSAAHPKGAKVLSPDDRKALSEALSGAPGGPIQQTVYPIRTGSLPLNYIVTADASVRVVDATNGLVIATGRARAQSLVSVDAKRGVMIGRDRIAPGPLASAHQYSIYVENESGSELPAGAPQISAPNGNAK